MLLTQMTKNVLSASEPLVTERTVPKGLFDVQTSQVESKGAPVRLESQGAHLRTVAERLG